MMFFVFCYGTWGSELHSTASTVEEAIETAKTASGKNHANEYVVELEPGGFENPHFKGGVPIGEYVAPSPTEEEIAADQERVMQESYMEDDVEYRDSIDYDLAEEQMVSYKCDSYNYMGRCLTAEEYNLPF